MLSTDELFHFTNFENLIGIIENGFYPKYNLEYTYMSDLHERKAMVAAVPMVCFCDIPLDLIDKHTSKYGNNAIGLDKTWGEKYGLNPVVYVQKNSLVGDSLASLANSFSEYKSSMIKDGSDMRIFVMISNSSIGVRHLSYFLKQYERLVDESIKVNGIKYFFQKGRFYDEREWRFVPPWITADQSWLIDIEVMNDANTLKILNEKLKKRVLKFELKDIKYVVYETLQQKERLIDAISKRYDIEIAAVESKVKFHLLSK